MKNILILLILFASSIQAGTIDPKTPDSKHIEYAKGFPYVGMLCGEYENGDLFCASAVAIDDFNILTAAHVVSGVKSCIFTLNEFSVHCIENCIVHIDFDASQFGIADIAIGHSKTSFDLKFYPLLYDTEDEDGKLCCIAGYGYSGTFISGSKKYDRIKRAGSNFIDKIDKNLLICSPSKRNEKDFTSLEFFIASGDSGGGLFIDNKLAGINSCVMAVKKIPESKYGEESGHTRISKFIDWIRKNKK
jgi:hypothetical protein